MPRKSETLPERAGMSRNSCAGSFRNLSSQSEPQGQDGYGLIALHLGQSFCTSRDRKESLP